VSENAWVQSVLNHEMITTSINYASTVRLTTETIDFTKLTSRLDQHGGRLNVLEDEVDDLEEKVDDLPDINKEDLERVAAMFKNRQPPQIPPVPEVSRRTDSTPVPLPRTGGRRSYVVSEDENTVTFETYDRRRNVTIDKLPKTKGGYNKDRPKLITDTCQKMIDNGVPITKQTVKVLNMYIGDDKTGIKSKPEYKQLWKPEMDRWAQQVN